MVDKGGTGEIYGEEGGSNGLNNQDRRAVENMCLTGMDLDGLYACFPGFPKEEIERIYNDVKTKPEEAGEDNVISVNCK